MATGDGLFVGGLSRYRAAMRSPAGACQGGALVELALVLPLLAAMLYGAAEFAMLAYDSIEVSDAARAGVAYGAQSVTTAADLSGMQSMAIAAGPDVSGMTAAATQFYSCSNAPAVESSSPPNCTGGNHLLTYVQVKTTAAVTLPIHIPGLSPSFTLNGLAVMRVQ